MQKKSASSALNTSSKPFFRQARRPLTFQLMNFMGWYSFMYDYPRVFCQPRSRGRTCAARHLPANERLWEKPRAGHARPLPLGKVFLRRLLHRVLFPGTADEPGHKAYNAADPVNDHGVPDATAPMPICTQSTQLRPMRQTSIEAVATTIVNRTSLAARRRWAAQSWRARERSTCRCGS